jgi:succinate dehydrogenase hydrophobic anchor subunit
VTSTSPSLPEGERCSFTHSCRSSSDHEVAVGSQIALQTNSLHVTYGLAKILRDYFAQFLKKH